MSLKSISIIKNLLRYTSKILIRNQKSVKDFKKNCKANKILIISLTHLGDMVLLSPFLRNLRMNFPSAQIDILLKERVNEILEYCPHINNRIIYNAKWITNKKEGGGFIKTYKIIYQLKRKGYDLAFITHPHIFNNIISWLAEIPFRVGYSDGKDGFLNIRFEKEKQIQHACNHPLNLLRYLDLKVESDGLEIYYWPGAVAFAEEFRKSLSLFDYSFFIGIHPGAGNKEKIWLPQRYARVIQYLIDKYNVHILLFAGRQDVEIVGKIKNFLKDYQYKISDFTGKTNIHQMVALMIMCKIVLANDSGPMHIASTLGIPTLALFVLTEDYQSQIWRPLSEESRVVLTTIGKAGRAEDIKTEDVISVLNEMIESVIKKNE